MKKIAFGMVSLISCIFLNFNFVDTYAYAETSVVTENITITEPELAPLVEDPEVIALESISLDQPTLSLTVGTNTQLTLGYSPADTTADRTAVWTSSNSGVAIVDATGNVTAIGVGIATLTATVGDKDSGQRGDDHGTRTASGGTPTTSRRTSTTYRGTPTNNRRTPGYSFGGD